MSVLKSAKEAFEASENPNIILEGVELAEKYKDMGKEGITNLVELFFIEEGYPLGSTRKLSITFLDIAPTTGNPTRDNADGIMVYRKDPEAGLSFGDIAIFMPNIGKSGKSGRVALLVTLLHEMAHVVQKFRGMEFDTTLEHADRAHEIEADEKVLTWTKRANRTLRENTYST